jgi:hypothetical protein
MGVLQKIPREGSIPAKELAADVGKNEEVIGMFPYLADLMCEANCSYDSSIDEDSYGHWNIEGARE